MLLTPHGSRHLGSVAPCPFADSELSTRAKSDGKSGAGPRITSARRDQHFDWLEIQARQAYKPLKLLGMKLQLICYGIRRQFCGGIMRDAVG
jgi:hypothetical protein